MQIHSHKLMGEGGVGGIMNMKFEIVITIFDDDNVFFRSHE